MLFVRLLILMGWYHKILRTLLKKNRSTPVTATFLGVFGEECHIDCGVNAVAKSNHTNYDV